MGFKENLTLDVVQARSMAKLWAINTFYGHDVRGGAKKSLKSENQ